MSTQLSDSIVEDLKSIIEKSGVATLKTKDDLMQELLIYIVHRDAKLIGHGIKLGKELANVNSDKRTTEKN